MKNKEPICLQLGAMKLGYNLFKQSNKEFSNAKVENIFVSTTSINS